MKVDANALFAAVVGDVEGDAQVDVLGGRAVRMLEFPDKEGVFDPGCVLGPGSSASVCNTAVLGPGFSLGPPCAILSGRPLAWWAVTAERGAEGVMVTPFANTVARSTVPGLDRGGCNMFARDGSLRDPRLCTFSVLGGCIPDVSVRFWERS